MLTQKQQDQISVMQQAIWDLEKAREKLVLAKSNTFVLSQLDDVITDVQEELNDLSIPLM